MPATSEPEPSSMLPFLLFGNFCSRPGHPRRQVLGMSQPPEAGYTQTVRIFLNNATFTHPAAPRGLHLCSEMQKSLGGSCITVPFLVFSTPPCRFLPPLSPKCASHGYSQSYFHKQFQKAGTRHRMLIMSSQGIVSAAIFFAFVSTLLGVMQVV